MDLAQSILKELITLQKKNEELARIITKLEHESDVIIQQFEHKIEELQKSLKHEQDDKARAARRYEEEIRDLDDSKNALILETADIRETFQARITELEINAEALTHTLNLREKEYSDLFHEKERVISGLNTDLATLQASFSAYQEEAEKERNNLSFQIKTLQSNLDQERTKTVESLQYKDNELRKIRDALHAAGRDLQIYKNREITSNEKSRRTIDNLHDLIHTERQIRSREIKERNDQIIALEEERDHALQTVSDLNDSLVTNKNAYDHEISRLEGLISDSQEKNSLLTTEISDLHSQIIFLTHEYEGRLKENEEKYRSEITTLQDSLSFLDHKLKTEQISYRDRIKVKDAEITGLLQKVSEIEEVYKKTLLERENTIIEFTGTVSALQAEKSVLEKQVKDTTTENTRLHQTIRSNLEVYDKERDAFLEEIAGYQNRISENEQNHKKEITAAREHLNSVVFDRDQILSEKLNLEEYYRGEISHLHDEIADIHQGIAERENSLLHDIAERDTRITALSINNESLRSEVERIRSQLGKLQATIRAEKDESVHALYREITTLENKLSDKTAEITSLSDRLIRLDAENTRLQQALSEKTVVPVPLHDKSTGITPDTSPVSDEILKKKSEIATLVADLDDPARAPVAAEKLTAMGGDIVDQLIPLLHSGSIQRRVWIAVVLYELNDNRATLPLMKLLETPKVHFRELIWEAKSQYHSRHRAASPASSAGFRIGPGGSGLL